VDYLNDFARKLVVPIIGERILRMRLEDIDVIDPCSEHIGVPLRNDLLISVDEVPNARIILNDRWHHLLPDAEVVAHNPVWTACARIRAELPEDAAVLVHQRSDSATKLPESISEKRASHPSGISRACLPSKPLGDENHYGSECARDCDPTEQIEPQRLARRQVERLPPAQACIGKGIHRASVRRGG
jgi:hypothetical protein